MTEGGRFRLAGREAMRVAGYALLCAVVFAIAIAWSLAQWHECRDAGFSRFYCIQHVS